MSTTIKKLVYLVGATRFRRISERLYVDGDKIYREAGINFKASWFPVYYVLAIAESPLTVLQITQQIDFSHITVKNVLRELEQEKLVSIETNPADRRSKLVSLSLKGQKLIYHLKPVWISFSSALKKVFQAGHPDFMNILKRIDYQIDNNSINSSIESLEAELLQVIDYKPGLTKNFHELREAWLSEKMNGGLKGEGIINIQYPDKKHFMEGGFFFYGQYKDQMVGFVALKRLDNDNFELNNLYIHPNYRNLGFDRLLVERCISRCNENHAKELWIQTSRNKSDIVILYEALGFIDKEKHPKMTLQEQITRIMCLEF